MDHLTYETHPKEKLYYLLRLAFSLVGYAILGLLVAEAFRSGRDGNRFLAFFWYGAMVFLFLFVRLGLLVGYVKGNAVKITRNQFPEAHAILESQARKLRLGSVPAAYILQSGGVLNAFATRFIGRNYVVIYSEVFELAYEQGKDALEFVIGHELGHIKRNHVAKSLYLLPSSVIPFLSPAYSRACEYTCDDIGMALNPRGAKEGLLILAAGKKLYKKVNVEEYISQEKRDSSFWKWFSEKLASHPNLPKRIDRMKSAVYDHVNAGRQAMNGEIDGRPRPAELSQGMRQAGHQAEYAGMPAGHQVGNQSPPERHTPAAQYFVSVNGRQTGPFDMRQLHQLAMNGQLQRDTYVWKQGMQNWENAGRLQELQHLL